MNQRSDVQFLVERRRFPRYICSMGNVEIFQSGRLWGWGKVDEISRCGCYVETTHPLLSGTHAQLRLTIAETSLDIAANVVCITQQVGMGMYFVVETPEQRNSLAQIVEEVKATALVSTAVLNAGSNPEEADHMQAALRHLQQSQYQLQKATQDEAGHCARALQLTQNAICEAKRAWNSESTMGTIDLAPIMKGFDPPHTQCHSLFGASHIGR